MRILLAGLALILGSSLASAQCACTCIGGRSVPACPSNSLVEPICQQICTERVEQSISSPAIGSGAIGGAPVTGGGSGGIDASALKALLGR